ncbi:MAG: ABC transporter permease [Lachnospiraceae bacterium]|nr:ABC transporter permease [Lachnospiraceae bacterium]
MAEATKQLGQNGLNGANVKSKKKRNGTGSQVIRRLSKNRLAMFGLIVLAIIVLICVFAPITAPYGPNDYDLQMIYATPCLKHPFGTDALGRDILSRLIYGGRYSLALGLCGAGFGMIAGCVLGCMAGYFGGICDNLIMRACDVLSAIPGQLLSIVISCVLGGGFFNTVLALCIGGIPGKVRLLRAQILSVRNVEYIEAAQSYNCSSAKTMFQHILPNTYAPLLVNLTMEIGGTIMAAAGLSFIGLGVQPPTPEWGAMLSAGRDYIRQYPHLIVFPGLVIMVTVYAINLFGDGLRDALDPKMKH